MPMPIIFMCSGWSNFYCTFCEKLFKAKHLFVAVLLYVCPRVDGKEPNHMLISHALI